MSRLVIILAVSFVFCATCRLPAEELAPVTDPIVGQWVWKGDLNVTVFANGTAKHPGQATGGWKLTHTNRTVERNYEFVWKTKGGKEYIETMVLSTDYQRLDGANQHGARIWAKRIN